MVAAYILAGELHHARGDYGVAFARYRDLFGPFVLNKQRAALHFASTFGPKSKFALFLRNRIMNLMTVPWVAYFAVGRDLADNLTVPVY
jgi:2-polyprenyl-6-methoxyphenol hydroxylase-like FAD-dependent oxidoreductase